MGPLWRGERVEEKPEGARAGCALSDPRNPLAKSEGRMPGDRATGDVFLWLLSLHKHCAAGAARTAKLAAERRRAGCPE
jgi:hypothetical protein